MLIGLPIVVDGEKHMVSALDEDEIKEEDDNLRPEENKVDSHGWVQLNKWEQDEFTGFPIDAKSKGMKAPASNDVEEENVDMEAPLAGEQLNKKEYYEGIDCPFTLDAEEEEASIMKKEEKKKRIFKKKACKDKEERRAAAALLL